MSTSLAASQLLDLNARSICVIKPSALGDVVQTLPLLPALRERFPEARISWVISRQLSDLLDGHPCLHETIHFDRAGSWQSWLRFRPDWRHLYRDLRKRSFDLVLDLQGLLRTGLMTAATGAPVRVGLETAREGAHWTYHYTVPETNRQVPAHVRYWRVADALGVGQATQKTVVWIPRRDQDWVDQTLQQLPGPLLAVHPGARWSSKRWPVEKFAAVASKAMRRFGFSIVVVGSPDERAIGCELRRVLSRLDSPHNVLDLTGQTTLKQLAAVLRSSNALLTNDSGPMHLAASLGTPVLGVFTCTSPEISGPPGDRHELVSTKVSCAASYKKRCPHRGIKHLACMDELSTERVCQAFERLMLKNQLAVRAA